MGYELMETMFDHRTFGFDTMLKKLQFILKAYAYRKNSDLTMQKKLRKESRRISNIKFNRSRKLKN
jgi:hypothetical protein